MSIPGLAVRPTSVPLNQRYTPMRGFQSNATLIRFGQLGPVTQSSPVTDAVATQPWWHPSTWASAITAQVTRTMAFIYFAPSSIRNWIPAFVTSSIHPDRFPGLFPHIQPVTIPSLDKTPLQAYWMPSPKPSKITVILGHGYYGDVSALLPVAKSLNDRGVNACLMEFRAHGGSGGRYTSLGYHEGQDIAAVSDWVKTTHGAEAKKLLYMGHSMGAAASMLMPVSMATQPEALNRVTQQLDGLILDSPYAYIRPKENRFVTFLFANKPSNSILAAIAGWVQPSIKQFFTTMAEEIEKKLPEWLNMPHKLSELQPAKWLAQHALGKKPILLMHAPDDNVTEYCQGEVNRDHLQAQPDHNVSFIAIPKGGHFAVDWQPSGFWHKCTTLIRGERDYMSDLMNFIAPFKQQSEAV